jgi:Cu+-exporting ATPase
VPVDGVILAGQSAVNTSALTGESLPVDKTVGEKILAGSVVENGSLTVRAEKLSKQTVAGQVIELTASALKAKSPGERLADTLARYFLPAVLAIAVAVFLINLMFYTGPFVTEAKKLTLGAAARLAIYPTLAVLVVACPCPLVLATPAAVIAALGRLAGTGVLIKGGAALERLARVNAAAFDKTGTLTEGKLELGTLFTGPGIAESELLQLAASVEQRSEHPIARLIVHEAARRSLNVSDVQDFQAMPGLGVLGRVDERMIRVGSQRMMIDAGIAVDAGDTWVSQLDRLGESHLLVSVDDRLIGAIGARDRLRPEAPGVLVQLQELGLAPLLLLTGDRASVAHAVAGQIPGLDVRAELLPPDKAEAVTSQSGTGPSYVFIGDGLNDAPALARATVGIAIGSGTEIAAEAGDVVMMGDPLRPLPLLIRLSRKTVEIIRQNIVWFGFGINGVGILLTGILWPLFAPSADWYEKAPLAGVLYHQLGSLAVLLNSMRLLAFERTTTNSALGQTRQLVAALDSLLGRLSIDELFHTVKHHARVIGIVLVSLLGLGWLSSGITQINPQEVGVVQRFGAVREDLAPGLHFRWPWPVETIIRIRPAEIRTVEVGFRRLSEADMAALETGKREQERLRRPLGDTRVAPGQTWSSPHAEGISRVTDESLMITGDGDLVELLATLRYTVAQPRDFLFSSRDPEAILRSSVESVFREIVARSRFQDLLGAGRITFEQEAQRALEAHLERAAPGGLGIRIEGLTVHDLHPPQDVVAAYYAVAEAIQRRDRAINEANADATRLLGRAQSDAERMLAQVRADAEKRRVEAQAVRDVFLAWQKSRTTLPADQEARLQHDRQMRIAAGQDPAIVQQVLDQERAKLLKARTELTEFRLALEAAAQAMKGRDKLLIDAEQIPGPRKLWLFDPDLFPRTAPLAFPRGGPTDQREPAP